jgi:hypothetical protein
MRALVAAALILAAAPAFADDTTGTVAAFNPDTKVLVLKDKSRWYLPADFVTPEDLAEGDRVRITYRSDADNGWKSIVAITRVTG